VDNIERSGNSGSGGTPPSAGFLLAWHLLVCLLLFMLPAVKLHLASWSDDYPQYPWVFAGVYGLAVMALATIRGRGRPLGTATVVVVMMAAFGLGFLYFLLHKPPADVPRSIIAGAFGVAVLLGTVGFVLRRFRVAAVGVLAVVLAATVGLQLFLRTGRFTNVGDPPWISASAL
jgi:hypothetical protein